MFFLRLFMYVELEDDLNQHLYLQICTVAVNQTKANVGRLATKSSKKQPQSKKCSMASNLAAAVHHYHKCVLSTHHFQFHPFVFRTGTILAVLYETISTSRSKPKRSIAHWTRWFGFGEMALLPKHVQQQPMQKSLLENLHQGMVDHVGGVPPEMSYKSQRGGFEELFRWR